jgi:hypothetical protein
MTHHYYKEKDYPITFILIGDNKYSSNGQLIKPWMIGASLTADTIYYGYETDTLPMGLTKRYVPKFNNGYIILGDDMNPNK